MPNPDNWSDIMYRAQGVACTPRPCTGMNGPSRCDTSSGDGQQHHTEDRTAITWNAQNIVLEIMRDQNCQFLNQYFC